MLMLICINQHRRNIWSSIHVKVKQHWGWVEKKTLLTKRWHYTCCFSCLILPQSDGGSWILILIRILIEYRDRDIWDIHSFPSKSRYDFGILYLHGLQFHVATYFSFWFFFQLKIFWMILFYPYKSKTSVVVLFARKLFWSALMLKFICYLYSLLPAKSVENVPKHSGKAK